MTDDALPRRTVDGRPTNLGRPLSLDQRTAGQIVGLLRRGLYQEDAVAAVGVSRSTYFAWLAKAREIRRRVANEHDEIDPDQLDALTVEELRLLDFLELVTGARATAEAEALSAVRDAFPTDWRAAAWYLERSWPDKYGRREQVTVQTDEQVEFRVVWPEELRPVDVEEIVDAEVEE